MGAADDTEIVDALRHIREKVAHGQAAFAVLAELPRGLQQVALLREGHPGEVKGRFFSMVPVQKGLGIEGVDVRGATLHEEKNDSFGPCRVVGQRRCGPFFRSQKGMESQLSEAKGGGPEELAALKQWIQLR